MAYRAFRMTLSRSWHVAAPVRKAVAAWRRSLGRDEGPEREQVHSSGDTGGSLDGAEAHASASKPDQVHLGRERSGSDDGFGGGAEEARASAVETEQARFIRERGRFDEDFYA